MAFQLMGVVTPFANSRLANLGGPTNFPREPFRHGKSFRQPQTFLPFATLFTSPSFKQTLLLDWNAMNIDGNVCHQFDMGFYAMVTLENYSFRNMTSL